MCSLAAGMQVERALMYGRRYRDDDKRENAEEESKSTDVGWLCDNGNPNTDVCFWTGVMCNDGDVTGIWLSDKRIIGSISPNIGSLQSLSLIDLSENKLTGELPQSLGYLRYLQALQLNSNELVGTIPRSYGSLSEIETMSLSTNRLSGSVPSSLCMNMELEILMLGKNEFSCYPSCLTSVMAFTVDDMELCGTNVFL